MYVFEIYLLICTLYRKKLFKIKLFITIWKQFSCVFRFESKLIRIRTFGIMYFDFRMILSERSAACGFFCLSEKTQSDIVRTQLCSTKAIFKHSRTLNLRSNAKLLSTNWKFATFYEIIGWQMMNSNYLNVLNLV